MPIAFQSLNRNSLNHQFQMQGFFAALRMTGVAVGAGVWWGRRRIPPLSCQDEREGRIRRRNG